LNEERNPTVKELWSAARTGMIWRNKPIENKLDKFSALRLWLEEEDITQGVIAVKASALYDNYLKWCKERQLTNIVHGKKDFGSFLKENFRSVIYSNSKHYFINKNIQEDEEAKKDRKKHGRSKKAKET
jgi:hypothetical protein